MSKPETIKIDEVEYVRKDQLSTPYVKRQEGPWEIGERYYVETVTKYFHGLLVDITKDELVLKEVAWIADTGRFWNFITGKSKPNEVEPFDPNHVVLVGRGALVSATKLKEKFGEQK